MRPEAETDQVCAFPAGRIWVELGQVSRACESETQTEPSIPNQHTLMFIGVRATALMATGAAAPTDGIVMGGILFRRRVLA